MAVGSYIEFRDPRHLIGFSSVNEATSDRLLTGGDIDPESLQQANGDLWVGDEFGPWLLHFDRHGVLLDPPYPVPGDLRSPNNPLLPTGTAPNPAQQPGHRGAGGQHRRPVPLCCPGGGHGGRHRRRSHHPPTHLRVQPPGPPLHRPPVGVPHPHRREHGVGPGCRRPPSPRAHRTRRRPRAHRPRSQGQPDRPDPHRCRRLRTLHHAGRPGRHRRPGPDIPPAAPRRRHQSRPAGDLRHESCGIRRKRDTVRPRAAGFVAQMRQRAGAGPAGQAGWSVTWPTRRDQGIVTLLQQLWASPPSKITLRL